MHYYSFNIGDYRKDTIHLSRLEHGIYRDLIDWYYLEETPIPKETQSVIRRLRLASEEEKTALENVLSDFFMPSDVGFRHLRIDADIAEYHAQCEKNKVNGKKGGRPKGKKTQSVSSGLPVDTQTDARANPNQEPITNNQEPIIGKPRSKPRQQLPADFYPNSTGEAAATAKGIDILSELSKFSDYHRAKGSVMADWQAAWRTWVGNAKPVAGASRSQPKSFAQQDREAGMARWEEMTGRIHPDRIKAQHGQVINATTAILEIEK
jgi:uncharacterized protein YdaU (DUF1376 family)